MSLKLQVIKGIRWSVVGSITVTIIQFTQNLILARLLSPEDFGLMAMVFVFLGFIYPLFDLGLSAAIIQKKEISSLQLSTIYWFNISLGVLCFIIAWVTAPIAGYFFEQKDLIDLIRLGSIVFLISPWGTQYIALLAKNLRFDLQNQITIAINSVSFFLAIGLALNGFGVLTLVYIYIFSKFFGTLIYIYFGRRYHIPSFTFNLKIVKELLTFGSFQTGAALVNFLSANIDKLLIGKFIGVHALGLYTIAWNLVLMPLRQVNPIVTKIAFPVFSKLQKEHKRISNYYTNAVLILMFINFPILLFIILNANHFLNLLYGEKWLGASVCLSILGIVGLLKTFANPGGSLILSKGRADIGFYWNIIWTTALFTFLSICLFLKPSIEAAAFGQLAAGLIFGPIWHWVVIKYGQVDYKKLIIELLKLISFFLPAFVFVTFVDSFNTLSLILSFSIKLIGGGILYVLYLFIFFKKRLPIILKIIK